MNLQAFNKNVKSLFLKHFAWIDRNACLTGSLQLPQHDGTASKERSYSKGTAGSSQLARHGCSRGVVAWRLSQKYSGAWIRPWTRVFCRM